MRWAVVLVSLILSSSVFAAKVTTQAVGEVVVFPQFSAPATVVAMNDSLVTAEVAGVVTEVKVLAGDSLEKGETLVRLDSFLFEQAVIQAQAALDATAARIELAEYQLKQAKRLSQQKNVSDELLVTRTAELAALQAEQQAQKAALAIAERNLKKASVDAPFSGVVAERFAQVGAQLNPGDPVVRLVAIEDAEVSAELAGRDAVSISEAKDLRYHWQEQSYPLELRTVNRVMDTATRTQEVRLRFLSHTALVGSSGRLKWQSAEPYLPADVLIRRENGLGVFVVEGGVARFVSLPSAQEGRSAPLGELSKDTRLIINGRHSLQDGDVVELR